MIDWLTQTSTDCAAPSADWLTADEQAQYAALKTDKRRHDWLLGRWTAKRLLQAMLTQATGERPSLAALSIHKASDGAPFATWDFGEGEAWGTALSLSHVGDQAFCALAHEPIPMGADIERVEPRAAEFVNDYFTQAEIALVMHAPSFTRDALITAIWSAKEAALKALHLGLTVDTRAITCRIQPVMHGPSNWIPFEIKTDAARLTAARVADAPLLVGWWRTFENYVLTLAAGRTRSGSPPPAPCAARLGDWV